MTGIDTKADDIYEAIADYSLNIGCSVMTPNGNRMEALPRLIKEYKADAVLDVNLQACHTYIVETDTVRGVCKKCGVPYMALETDYSTTDAGQISTRISAFIETLDE